MPPEPPDRTAAEGLLATTSPGVRVDGRATPPGALPAAVLWDMDGTLVDTEPYWVTAEQELAAGYGATWTEEDGLALVGHDLIDSAHLMRARMGLPLTPAEIVDFLLDRVVESVRREIPWRPGSRDLLGSLNGAGVPCALVTMSWRRFADEVLAALPAGSFEATVTGDEVERGKPHPEPYLAAAAALGVHPADCVAIEDSHTGATSALAAGCRVLVVPHVVEVPSTPGLRFADSLVGVDPVTLAAL